MNTKVANATKWSFITEIVAKIISPVTNMILARLLAPEMFGVITTVTMIISFADIFSDAGFQKFLIQHEFEDNKDLYKSSDVAFTVNLMISVTLWGIISVFSGPLANLLGNSGKGLVLIVACISLPLTSFSSIQMALFKRKFDFKRLFYARLVGSLIPLFVTVPLAALLHNYWALVIGTICGNLSNAIILTLMSEWKPKIGFNLSLLREMLSYSLWVLLESLVTWLTSYVDVFILGTFLSSYYLGVYKTSMTTISQILAVITGATNSVLFSALSRQQDNKKEFDKTFYNFQHTMSILVIPLGVGIYAYREFVTGVLLGSQWGDAIEFIGIWGLVGGFYVVLGGYCSELYRAKGRPKISALAQIIYTIVIFIVIEYSKNISFEAIYISRTLSRVLFIGLHFILVKVFFDMSISTMVKSILPATISSVVMYCFSLLMHQFGDGFFWNVISILLCITVYFAIICLFPKTRSEIMRFIRKIKKDNVKS